MILIIIYPEIKLKQDGKHVSLKEADPLKKTEEIFVYHGRIVGICALLDWNNYAKRD